MTALALAITATAALAGAGVAAARDICPTGQPLELLVGNVVQKELVVSSTGTLAYSVDMAQGDAVPDAAPGTQIVFTHPDFLAVGGGDLHA